MARTQEVETTARPVRPRPLLAFRRLRGSVCRAALASVVLAASAAGARDARAELPPQPSSAAAPDSSAEELREMDLLLDHFEGESTRYRVWNSVVDTTLGAASLTAGGFVLDREMVLPGFVLLARGGVSLTNGVLDLAVYQAPFEELHRHFEARRMSGLTTGQVVDETAREWRTKAQRVRGARMRSGVTSIAVGTLLFGLGAAAAVGNLGFPSDSVGTTDRASFASLFMAFGGTTLSSGVRSLLVEDPIEAGWQAYARRRSTAFGSLNFQAIALRQGGYASLSFAF